MIPLICLRLPVAARGAAVSASLWPCRSHHSSGSLSLDATWTSHAAVSYRVLQ